MSDDNYGSDLQPWIEPELEARVVALVLGEASEFEAGELERLMEERPEIRLFKRRIETVHELLGEAVGPQDTAGWKLSQEKRRELLGVIGSPAARPAPAMLAPGKEAERRKEAGIRKAGRRVLWVAAACFVLTLFLFVLLPGDRRGSMTPQASRFEDASGGKEAYETAGRSGLMPGESDERWGGEVAAREEEEVYLGMSRAKPAEEPPTPDAAAVTAPEEPEAAMPESRVADELTRLRFTLRAGVTRDHGGAAGGKRGASPAEKIELAGRHAPRPAAPGVEDVSGGFEADDLSTLHEENGETAFGAPGDGPTPPERKKPAARGERPLDEKPAEPSESRPRTVPLDTSIPPPLIEGTPKPMKVPGLRREPEGPVIAGEAARGGAGKLEYRVEAGGGADKEARKTPAQAKDKEKRLDKSTTQVNGRRPDERRVTNTGVNLDLVEQMTQSSLSAGPSEAPDPGLSERRKSAIIEESLEKSAEEEPFSTFSLHISDVSFKLAKAALDKGEWPEAGAIRVEEFVNAFDYGDPAPTQEQKVACAIEQAAHPFMQQRNLVRISMRTAALGRAGGIPLRLTVLVDTSGSMERADRTESVRNAFDLLAAQLQPQDQVTLIGFARTPRLLADRMGGDEGGKFSRLVESTPAEGGTNIEEALELGIAKAREQFLGGAQNRIILLTDGAANLGNAKPAELAKLVELMRQAGIAFDACGVGAEGLNDEILEALTRKGDGRYYFLDRPEDADAGFARQIAGALRPAARNVKIQVEFNPKRVGRYKLYGFEKHRLEKEDFRNDSVDAAEMAAEEAGNAIYQVQVLPDGQGEIGTVSVRFRDTATDRMVERLWAIPHDPNAPRLEEAAPSMRLAGVAAFLGEKLKGSAIGDLVEMKTLGRIGSELQAACPHNERVAHMAAMIAKVRELAPD